MKDISKNDISTSDLIYFAPLLPWQIDLWRNLTTSTINNQHSLPHGLLAAGNAGIGKRAFVWRWVAWQLCVNRHRSLDVACGNCESCQWLKAGTHPDLEILPKSSSPTFIVEAPQVKSKKIKVSVNEKHKISKIKIDDIRGIQDFVQRGSSDIRICILDHVDTMTIAAANALLKTLEEPREGVQLILISDKPSLLLPTVKSRTQQLPLTKMDLSIIENYLSNHLNSINADKYPQEQIKQLLILSANSPLQAIDIAASSWYQLRSLWLKTWQALKNKSRSSIAASDYWQGQLDINDFITLSQLMLADLVRLSHNMPTYQQDIAFSEICNQNIPSIQSLQHFQSTLDTIKQSQKQNVQDKLAYDMLMQELCFL